MFLNVPEDRAPQQHGFSWEKFSPIRLLLLHVLWRLTIELTFEDFYLNIVPSSSTFLHIVTLNPCHMTHSYMWQDLCVCVTWRIPAHHQVWTLRHDSFICVTWRIHTWDITHPYVWRDMTRSCVWHVTIPFMYVTCYNFRLPQLCHLRTQSEAQNCITASQSLMLLHMPTSRYSMRLLWAWDSVNISPYLMQLLCHYSICRYRVIQCDY